MTTISVPLDKDTARDLERLEQSHPDMSRSAIVRKAVKLLAREQALEHIKEAEADIRAGRVYTGNIRDLMKKIH